MLASCAPELGRRCDGWNLLAPGKSCSGFLDALRGEEEAQGLWNYREHGRSGTSQREKLPQDGGCGLAVVGLS